MSERPAWFRLEPDGPHRQSGGIGGDDYTIVYYCAKDGEPWPCETERGRADAGR